MMMNEDERIAMQERIKKAREPHDIAFAKMKSYYSASKSPDDADYLRGLIAQNEIMEAGDLEAEIQARKDNLGVEVCDGCGDVDELREYRSQNICCDCWSERDD